MEMSTKESGKKTKPMAMESTFMQMEPSTKDTGLMINKKDLAKSNGLIIVVLQVTIKMVKSTALVNLYGLMEPVMKAIGWIIKCTVRVFSFGQMVASMRESMRTIASMALALLLGQMAEDMKVYGSKVNKSKMIIIIIALPFSITTIAILKQPIALAIPIPIAFKIRIID